MILPIEPDFSKHKEIQNFLKDPKKVGRVLKLNATGKFRKEIVEHYLPGVCHTDIQYFFRKKPSHIKDFKYDWIWTSTVPSSYPKKYNYKEFNKKAIKKIKECAYQKDFAIVDIKLRLETKGSVYPDRNIDIYPYKKNATAGHAAVCVLDFRGTVVRGYYIDSAGARSRKKQQHQIEKSLEMDISNMLGMKVTMISFDDDSCPVFNVQKGTPYCGTWSLFMLISHILNKSRTKVYSYLSSIGEDCRYRILTLFLFEIWEIIGKPTGDPKEYYMEKLYDVWDF